MEHILTDDLQVLISVLPPHLKVALADIGESQNLLEIVLDLGRLPEARYTHGEKILAETEVTEADIDYIVSRIGDFSEDNRAGIPRTLHRISAIRNRKGRVVGLTCRVGRAVFGTMDIIRDIVESGKSVLLLGRPGVGKTTMLREAARVLGDTKRVVIVDTSNEIGGDGDIPHPAIGKARRMQVPKPALQHEVMIEAVENHMPEVIVIDEIGRELEAEAARTIAERGVQLIGTAHGQTLDNLLMNPTLMDLVGGIQSVTLSDEEARRRGTQKSILERKAPPTFDILVEIQARNRVAAHNDVAAAVDSFLRGRPLSPEIRTRDVETGAVDIRRPETRVHLAPRQGERATARRERGDGKMGERPAHHALPAPGAARKPMRFYPYGVSQDRLETAAKALDVPIRIVDDVNEAEAVLTLRNYYKKRPPAVVDAERSGIPVYVLRSNTIAQMEGILEDLFGVAVKDDPLSQALQETNDAIQRVLNGTHSVELAPQSAFIRRFQHERIREANLFSRSLGKEPRRRVRVYASEVG
ncbi:MAG: AAA family ATPase [Chloroflexi bacterium UTCFX4]|jgi:stage III sporulation protein SpoIIIAA|nr:MAG: AAA family ATPase [Chloroflexi bacterium UTCFX4]